ncbi:hypothetical protein SynMITS9220_00739 [Synechococcus sp. MIT S9220]|nr:hypothetical protein SynMITS9220_00739 [Synechococcus sp. MIT S9220]
MSVQVRPLLLILKVSDRIDLITANAAGLCERMRESLMSSGQQP